MTLQERINAFIKWGNAIAAMLDELESDASHEGNKLAPVISAAQQYNQWFTADQTKRALRAITFMLDEKALKEWISAYADKIEAKKLIKKVAVIIAGNIPAVGFH